MAIGVTTYGAVIVVIHRAGLRELLDLLRPRKATCSA
jgi:hypothetical protein